MHVIEEKDEYEAVIAVRCVMTDEGWDRIGLVMADVLVLLLYSIWHIIILSYVVLV